MENKRVNDVVEEKKASAISGVPILLLTLILLIAAVAGMILAFVNGLIVLGILMACYLLVGWIPFCGLKMLRPNEAYVLTLFGKYYGTLKGPGYYFVHPFCSSINPIKEGNVGTGVSEVSANLTTGSVNMNVANIFNKRISLKTMTLNNDRQKINDKMGNPIVIGIVVIWRVENTARAVFNVDNFAEFLSIQCDAALRNIVRMYPYDVTDDQELGETSLRGSSIEIAQNLREEIQSKVEVAGLEIIEARITHLAYAPEIAAAMLQRQQANAIIDARQMIVEGAVGMVEMALAKLSDNNVVELDEERKAAMVSNLLVVLCGNRDAQPIVNSGSLY